MKTLAITHSGQFHADELFGLAVLEYAGISFDVERRKPTGGELETPNVIVIDIGGQLNYENNNFDHHQDKELPSSNVLVARKYLSQKLSEYLENGLFGVISDNDTGKNISKFNDCGIYDTIRKFNNLESGFEMARKICFGILKAEIATAEKVFESERLWTDAEKKSNYAISDHFIMDWQKKAEREGVVFMLTPNPRGGWQISSRDSKSHPIPEHESQTFIHANKFMAVYPSKEAAVAHATNL